MVRSAKGGMRWHEEEREKEEVGVDESVKRVLEVSIQWFITKKEELKLFGLTQTFKGILLYGPPVRLKQKKERKK